jgi:hypothetical protein
VVAGLAHGFQHASFPAISAGINAQALAFDWALSPASVFKRQASSRLCLSATITPHK